MHEMLRVEYEIVVAFACVISMSFLPNTSDLY